ncbi:MAG: Flp pilus assembly protein CpaB [Oryzihumus sp.]
MTAGAGLLAAPSPTLVDRAQRLLLAGWRGRGRRAAWRRTRARRVLAALLVGLAVWLTLGAVQPRPAPTGVPVVVAAHDLAAGQALTGADLRVARWAPDTRPAGSVAEVAGLVGRRVSAPVTASEALTPSRLHGPGLLTGLAADQVATHVSVPDARVAALLRPGDHVDVIDNGSGTRIGVDLLVLATDPADAGSSSWTGVGSGAPAPGVVLAVTPEQASALARATGAGDLSAGVTLTLRPAG